MAKESRAWRLRPGIWAAAFLCQSVLCCCVVPPASAIDPSAGTGGAAFTKLGMGSTRAMAMGRAFVALAEGTDALTWNPAGLALTQSREANYSYLRYIQDVETPLYMAYAHPLGRTVFGANVAYLSVDGFEVRDETGKKREGSDVSAKAGFGTVSAARSFWYEKLFLGASLKAVQEDLAGVRRGSLVGDFGVIFKPNQLASFGFSSQNFGGNQAQVGKISRFGAAVRVFELMNLSLELSKPSDSDWRVGVGGEFTLPEELLAAGQVSLRFGYYRTDNQGPTLPTDRHMLYPLVGANGLSFGLGLFTSQAFGYGIGFDYALVPMGALGNVDQLALKVRF